MKELTQKEIVLKKLKEEGKIDNFWCIHNYILRLGGIIHELKKDGYYFRGEYIENTKNFQYTLLPTNGLKI